MQSYPTLSEKPKVGIFTTELESNKKRYLAVLPDGQNIRKWQGIKLDINKFIQKYIVKNEEDDITEINKALAAQKEFDKRAFLEFRNYIDKEFEEQEEVYRINNKMQEMRIQSRIAEENQIMLFTPDGKIINSFKDIEGIYDQSKLNLGFIVASWTGYFVGMKGYDPDHGAKFQRSFKEKQVKEGIEKLQAEWEVKRNEISFSNRDQAEKGEPLSDKIREKTLYIWRNESYRYRFQPKLGSMNPVHLHNQPNNKVSESKDYHPSVQLEGIELAKQQNLTPTNKKKSSLPDDNAKSHAMMVQATAKDILSFESIWKLSK